MQKNGNKQKLKDDILVIPSQPEYLEKVEIFSKKISRKASLSEDKSDNVAIVLTELVNNAILHGNKGQPEKKVTIKASYHKDHFRLSVKDEGSGFDPAKLKDPRNPENIWKETGRGIFLVKQLIDKVEFFPSEEGTEIVATVYINQA
jgi:serine/threonine-protein kinase RsbW